MVWTTVKSGGLGFKLRPKTTARWTEVAIRTRRSVLVAVGTSFLGWGAPRTYLKELSGSVPATRALAVVRVAILGRLRDKTVV